MNEVIFTVLITKILAKNKTTAKLTVCSSAIVGISVFLVPIDTITCGVCSAAFFFLDLQPIFCKLHVTSFTQEEPRT